MVANKIHAHTMVECSAKTGENIQKVFEIAGRAAISKRKPQGSGLFNCKFL